MLTPQTLQQLPDELVDLVSEVQMDIIQSIAKKLVKADYLTPSAEWQLYKATQLRLSTNEVNKLLAKYTGKSKRQISKLYTEACKEAINNDAKIYRAYGKDCSAALRSVALSNTLKAGIKNANGMTKNLCKSMVESSRTTVTHLMDKAWLKVQSGAFTYQDAIYDAVAELAEQGITAVTYPSGKTDWADVAVRRAVMTGVSQTAGQMQLDFAEEMDCDLVEVTAHMGARPSHAVWQGKVYSISGKSKKYPKLSTATGYGTGDGLKGWNCRHDFYPFFEGVSERANMPVDISENNEQYALSQKQRAMERSIRASKRRLAAYDGALAETEDEVLKLKLQNQFERHSAILKTKEKRLSEFCDKNGLYPEKDRVRVVGFGKSVSQKAVHGSKRYVKTQGGGSTSINSKYKTSEIQDTSQDKNNHQDNLIKSISKHEYNDPIQNKSLDYMSKSFRPKYSTATSDLYADGIYITTKKVKNSSFDIVTDTDATKRDKAVRLSEQLLTEIQDQLPEGFVLPKVAVVDFDKHGLNQNAIGGFHSKSGVIYINSKYDTRAKILEYVKANKDYFANTTEYAPLLHELGHKYYEDSIKTLAKTHNIEYNKAKDIIDNRIYNYIHSNNDNGRLLLDNISIYADKGYSNNKYTEIIAECFSINENNSVANDIINILRGDFYDDTAY